MALLDDHASSKTSSSSSSRSLHPPTSSYTILPTPYGGRGAFSSHHILKGTTILTCEAPYASVVLRKFKKEVCAWCFAYAFEHGKRKWDVRISSDGDMGLQGQSKGQESGDKKRANKQGANSGSGAWFCTADCRERWVRQHRGQSLGAHEGGASRGESHAVGWWFRIHDTLEKLVISQNRREKTRKNQNQGIQNARPITVQFSDQAQKRSFPLAYLETLKAPDITPQAINSAWSLADDVFWDPAGVGVNLRSWAASITTTGENEVEAEGMLNEFELDTVRFVLDGLVRRAVQELSGKSLESHLSEMDLNREEGETAEKSSNSNMMGAGNWDDLLALQNNEVQHVRSQPYILASKLRVYAFVKQVVHSAIANQRVFDKHQTRKDAGAHRSSRPSETPSRISSGTPTAAEQPSISSPSSDTELVDSAVFLPLLSKTKGIKLSVLDLLVKYVASSDGVRAILARDHGNVFGIWDMAPDDEESEMLGWGMYVFGSYFNHDCNPNLKKRRIDRKLQFYTTRDVLPGEELCINYVDVSLDATVKNRSQELKKDWFFVCQCERCVLESGR